MKPARAWLLTPILALALAGCGEPVPPSPTPSPATAPTIVVGSFTGVDGRWTFNASVHPRGSPTDVVLEYYLGPEGSGDFDQHVAVESGLFESGTVTAQLELADDAVFCARFTATNEVGSTSSEARCFGLRPPGMIVVPGDASPSAAPWLVAPPWSATDSSGDHQARSHRPDQPSDPSVMRYVASFRPESSRTWWNPPVDRAQRSGGG